MTGRWEGDYSSAATGRSGSIVFEFKPGDLAYGDVLMWDDQQAYFKYLLGFLRDVENGGFTKA